MQEQSRVSPSRRLNPIARNPLDVLLPKNTNTSSVNGTAFGTNQANDISQWRWGTVIDDDGHVQLDNDADPLSDPPPTLVPLTSGQRVWVQIYQRRAIVHGVSQSEVIQQDTDSSDSSTTDITD